MRHLCTLVLLALGGMSHSGLAKEDDSHCAAVYANATRNVDTYTKTLAEQSELFTEHCEANGSLRKSSESVDLTIPVKAIKLGFSGNQEEARSEMQKFCKRHQESAQRIDTVYHLNNTVVVDALRSFNQCLALSAKSVKIWHEATDTRSLAVHVGFTPDLTKVTLNSVQYDEGVATCIANPAGGSNVAVKFPMDPIAATGNFSVACTRKSAQTQSGSQKFNRFELLVDTNHGAYTVVLPTEEMLGYDLANINRAAAAVAAQRQLALQNDLDRLKNERESLQAKMAKPHVRVFSIGQGDGLGPTQLPCAANVNNYAAGTCPSPGVLTEIIRIVPESKRPSCGYRVWQWSCVTYQ